MLIGLAVVGAAVYLLKQAYSSPKNVKPANPSQLLNKIGQVLSGKAHQQQLAKQAPSAYDSANYTKRNAHRELVIAGGAVVCALLSPLSPIFSGLTIAFILYRISPLFPLVWANFKQGKIITIYLEMLILVLGMLMMGYLLIPVIAGLLQNLFLRIMQNTEHHAETQLSSIVGEQPNRVWIEKDGLEIEVDFTTISVGDTVIVTAGEVIPVDGTIQQGEAIIDQHILTGESQPVERKMGESVFAATLLVSGRIHIHVDVAGDQTVAANIGNVLEHTQHYKDQLMARGMQTANRFLPYTWGLAAVTVPILGPTAGLSILYASFGLNMSGLGPLSVLSYLHILSQRGILVKDGRVLESLHQVDTIVFDKTGTLTLEQPTVGQVHCLAEEDADTLLRYAAIAEYRQPHPIAKAILAEAERLQLDISTPDASHYHVGYGIQVQVKQNTLRLGSARFLQSQGIAIPEAVADIQQQAEDQGYSLIYLSIDKHLSGILELHPSIRPEAKSVIATLKQRGFELYIISGDHERPTRRLANELGIDHYIAETLPEHKADRVKQLRDEGKFVCFIGDGINDALALKSAQISVSLQGASTAATDTAQVILMDGTLKHLLPLFELTDEFEQTMHGNFLTTMVPGAICVGGVYFWHFSLVASMITYYAGTAVGLGNALVPLLKHEQTNNVPKQLTTDKSDS